MNARDRLLMRAIKSDDIVRVKAALESGASVSAQNENGWRPLFLAAFHGNPVIIQELLKAGADVHADADVGFTALYAAVAAGHLPAASVLVDAGARPEEGPDGRHLISFVPPDSPRLADFTRVLKTSGGRD